MWFFHNVATEELWKATCYTTLKSKSWYKWSWKSSTAQSRGSNQICEFWFSFDVIDHPTSFWLVRVPALSCCHSKTSTRERKQSSGNLLPVCKTVEKNPKLPFERRAEQRDKHIQPFNPPTRLISCRSVMVTRRSESASSRELKLIIGLIRRSGILMRRSVMKPLALKCCVDRAEKHGLRHGARSLQRLVIQPQWCNTFPKQHAQRLWEEIGFASFF